MFRTAYLNRITVDIFELFFCPLQGLFPVEAIFFQMKFRIQSIQSRFVFKKKTFYPSASLYQRKIQA